MTEKPRPTNAECTDVANAVLDGTDCVMLSGETANGKYPIESVETMARILVQAERLVNWEAVYIDVREETLHSTKVMSVWEAVCSSAVEVSLELNSRLIVVASDSGKLGLLVAKYRPRARILVVTESELVANQMCVSRGVEGMVVSSISNLGLVWEEVLKFTSRPHNRARYVLPIGHPIVMVDSPSATQVINNNNNDIRWNMVQVQRIPENHLTLNQPNNNLIYTSPV
jgi:pyruvate kinase